MHIETITGKDRAPRIIPAAPWRIATVEVKPDFRLFVRFNDCTTGEADLSRLIMSEQAGVFLALRDPALFAQVRLEYGAVVWPGDIDLALMQCMMRLSPMAGGFLDKVLDM